MICIFKLENDCQVNQLLPKVKLKKLEEKKWYKESMTSKPNVLAVELTNNKLWFLGGVYDLELGVISIKLKTKTKKSPPYIYK